MVDIHCHILPGVDDGSPSMEDSLQMARMAADSGVTDIIATPHCNLPGDGPKNYRSAALRTGFSRLRQALEQEGIPLRIHPGAEVFCTPELPELLDRRQLQTLGGGRYLLVEFYFDESAEFMEQCFHQIRTRGLTPVAAHPERYKTVQQDPYMVRRWFERGVVIQLNKGSILGRLGRRAQDTALWLLERGLAHAAASDAHRPTVRTTHMELLRRTKEGDMEAREQLIAGNLRLVLSVIQKFTGRGESADDLFQVGCIGLIKAIDNFDAENHDVRFSTYGVPMIVGEIRRYLRDNSAIRVSRSLRDTAYKVLQARERLLRQSQREPTVEQLAQELAIPREEVVLAMDAIVDPVSLYEPIYSEGGDTVCVMDQVSDRRCTDESWIQRIALKDAISRLTPRERSILMMRFNQGKTQMEVSAQIGISQAQVSRLEKGAIRAIKKEL